MRVFARISKVAPLIGAMGLAAIAGCGDDGNPDAPDARPAPDAMADPADADTTPDAGTPTSTHSGQISVLDVRVNGIPQLGAGSQLFVGLNQIVDDTATKIYDDRNMVGAGCAAWVYDFAMGQFPAADEGHGTITVTGTDAPLPPCVFVAGDYACVAAQGAFAANDSLTPNAGNNTITMTVAAGAFSSADVGRYVKIGGAPHWRHNGAFPIVAAPTATTIVYGNPAAALTPTVADAAGYTYVIVGGAGPNPASVDFIADGDMVTVALDAPDGDAFEDFTSANVPSGHNFSLAPASMAQISGVAADGAAISLECDADVASATGTGPALTAGGGNDEWLLTAAGAFAAVRAGAEITIAGATTAGNNGTFTITAADSNTVTFVNANGAAEAFVAGSSYAINDCGTATLSAVSLVFNNAPRIKVHLDYTGDQAAITTGAGDACVVTRAGEFSLGFGPVGDNIVISDATTAGNNGTFPVLSSTADAVTYTNTNCAAESFVAATKYSVERPLQPFEMPDASLGTKAGSISCATLAGGKIDVPAEAMKAIMDVGATSIRTLYVRAGLGGGANADLTNRTNVLVGHAVVGFSAP